ncbi:hypothetical protein KAJ89_03310 [Candidatus Parcubacteria bacterium]|nr:hypothetical protein [Candidatus Parcubacteria bacterium]
MAQFKEKISLDAVVADTNGVAVNIEGYKRVGIQLLAASISSGNGVFTFEGTIDGTNWVALNMIIDNVANATANNPTRVASKTLNSDTSILLWLDNFLALKAIRVVVDVTTDGAYSAFVIAGN